MLDEGARPGRPARAPGKVPGQGSPVRARGRIEGPRKNMRKDGREKQVLQVDEVFPAVPPLNVTALLFPSEILAVFSKKRRRERGSCRWMQIHFRRIRAPRVQGTRIFFKTGPPGAVRLPGLCVWWKVDREKTHRGLLGRHRFNHGANGLALKIFIALSLRSKTSFRGATLAISPWAPF